MKKLSIYFSFITAAVLFLAGCSKVDPLPYYNNGSPVTVTASKTAVAPAPADSLSTAVTFTWSSPNYGTDPGTYKFIIELDSAKKNFANPLSKTITGATSGSFTAKELNTFLVNRGYAFGTPVTLEARVTSSYSNNNERLYSVPITLTVTPYKVPPKVPLPASGRLFIVGDATTFGWSNDAAPAFPPEREFARIDETTWGGIFYLTGSGGYKLLQTQGNWDTQFHMISGGTASSGDFEQKNADPTFPSPTAGWYRIILDFQQGKYTVTPYAGALPDGSLYIVGDATAGGWNNPVPVPAQQFTRVNSAAWEITLPLTGGKEFLVLPFNGEWSKKYALKDNSLAGIDAGGEFGYHQDGQPAPDDFQKNFKAPAASGTYKITLNFAAPTTTPGASGRFTIK